MLVEVKVIVVVGTVVLVIKVTGRKEVLVTVKMSFSVIVSEIEPDSVIMRLSVRVNSTVAVEKGPVRIVDVVTMGGPA